jgi:DNA topoisomerase-1
MADATHVIAGRCTTEFEGTREQEQYGDMVVLAKPDGTVLVHDADGYQPVAWLTRASTVTVGTETVTARDGDQSLTVEIDEEYARARYQTGDAGLPVGACPDCKATLVRTNGRVDCPDCEATYSIPSDATVLDETCSDCGCPRFRVERGHSFVVCLDYECESLDDRVRSAFDREFDCPECGDDLRVLRRTGLLLGCDAYPECETGFAFPAGRHDGACPCGLPAFETATGRRCLDSQCGALETGGEAGESAGAG